MAFESRTSRNGPVKPPGPPTRKNTFQKMLDLERKNKVRRALGLIKKRERESGILD